MFEREEEMGISLHIQHLNCYTVPIKTTYNTHMFEDEKIVLDPSYEMKIINLKIFQDHPAVHRSIRKLKKLPNLKQSLKTCTFCCCTC
jgi:hypothetical protein